MIGKTNSVTCGAGFGHTVEFINEGANYARYMVTDGQSVPQPSPNPTKTGLRFYRWVDSLQNAITFPYTPTGDITLSAVHANYREDMCLSEADKTICVLSGRNYYKTNAGWAIAGYTSSASMTAPVLVALSADDAAVTALYYGSTDLGGSFVYHDITYYYCGSRWCWGGEYTSTATDVTELYKCTDTTMAAAALTLVKRYLGEI